MEGDDVEQQYPTITCCKFEFECVGGGRRVAIGGCVVCICGSGRGSGMSWMGIFMCSSRTQVIEFVRRRANHRRSVRSKRSNKQFVSLSDI